MKTKEALIDWSYKDFVKMFREGEDSSNFAFTNAIIFCLQKLYEGDMKFKSALVDGFMYSRDYSFILDLSLPEFEHDFELLKRKIEETALILGFNIS